MKPRWSRVSIALLIVAILFAAVYERCIAPYRFADLLYAYGMNDQVVDSYNQVGGLQVKFVDEPKDDGRLSKENAKELDFRIAALRDKVTALQTERTKILGEIEQLDQIKGARVEALSKMLGQSARKATFFSIISGFFTALLLQWLFQNERVRNFFTYFP